MGSGTQKYLGLKKDFGRDVFPEMLSAQEYIAAFATNSPYYDIGTVNAYRTVNKLATEGNLF